MEEDILRNAGLKATPRRLAMLTLLLSSDQPLTAEEIELILAKQGLSADLSTVYRALNTMCDKAVLQKSVHLDGVVYYSMHAEQHHHQLVCESCHRCIEIDSCPLEQLSRSLREQTGYTITGHQFEISGICPDCAKKRYTAK